MIRISCAVTQRWKRSYFATRTLSFIAAIEKKTGKPGANEITLRPAEYLAKTFMAPIRLNALSAPGKMARYRTKYVVQDGTLARRRRSWRLELTAGAAKPALLKTGRRRKRFGGSAVSGNSRFHNPRASVW